MIEEIEQSAPSVTVVLPVEEVEALLKMLEHEHIPYYDHGPAASKGFDRLRAALEEYQNNFPYHAV